MAFRPLSSFIPSADELLALELPRLGGILLLHLKSYEGLNTVYQHAGLNRGYFRAMLENRNVGLGPLPKEPEYGARQPEVTKRMMEAWNWLERRGLLIHNDQQPADWFTISSDGEALLKQSARFEQWEKLGVDRVKSDLTQTGGVREVGGTLETRDLAWKWVKMKEEQATAIAREHAAARHLTVIADSRLDELRALSSAQFDFKKLIRLCEEINTAYSEGCYFATAMLTRGLLDHVPPIFGKASFSEVANNYSGGVSRSGKICITLRTPPGKSLTRICTCPYAKARRCRLLSRSTSRHSSTCSSPRLYGLRHKYRGSGITPWRIQALSTGFLKTSVFGTIQVLFRASMKSTTYTRGPERVFGTHPLMEGRPESDTGRDRFQAPRHFQILIRGDILILTAV